MNLILIILGPWYLDEQKWLAHLFLCAKLETESLNVNKTLKRDAFLLSIGRQWRKRFVYNLRGWMTAIAGLKITTNLSNSSGSYIFEVVRKYLCSSSWLDVI